MKTRVEGLRGESEHRQTCNPYTACSSDNMWRTPSNIPDIVSRLLRKEPTRYTGDPLTPSPSQSSYFYTQTMTCGYGCSLTLANILFISWCWSQAKIWERAEMNPQRQPLVGIHFSIVRPGTGGGSEMTSETGTTTMTMRVSTTAAAAKTKTMSITGTMTMSRCSQD